MNKLTAILGIGLGLFAAGLYWSSTASTTPAAPVDYTAVEALREDQMRKLMFHEVAKEVSQTGFVDAEGAPVTLGDYRGKHVLVNFWATWCYPCRKEMPSLARLNAELGGAAFEVVTIATGRNAPEAIARFFAEQDITGLPQHRDPRSALAAGMGVAGLPISILLNPEGQEIARLPGDAEWDTDSAKAIIGALIDG